MKKSREWLWRVDGSQIRGLCVFMGLDDKYEMAAAYVSCHTMTQKSEKEVTSKQVNRCGCNLNI